VGFNHVGNATEKFFWYWCFNFLQQATMLFLGEFYVALTPNEASSQVLSGLTNTIMGLFCGFLIQEQNFPTFWLFMYWINPLHYTLEGLITSQFHGDDTEITLLNGDKSTAEGFIEDYQFTTWSYSHVGYDVLALCIFISIFM
jgi:ABC-type multidrug transport system permease subunit